MPRTLLTPLTRPKCPRDTKLNFPSVLVDTPKKTYPVFKPAQNVSGVTFWSLKYTRLSYKMYPDIAQPNIYNANKSYTCGVQ